MHDAFRLNEAEHRTWRNDSNSSYITRTELKFVHTFVMQSILCADLYSKREFEVKERERESVLEY